MISKRKSRRLHKENWQDLKLFAFHRNQKFSKFFFSFFKELSNIPQKFDLNVETPAADLGALNLAALVWDQDILWIRKSFATSWLAAAFHPPVFFSFLSEYSHAKELICVPVDVTDTLRCFRQTLEKSKYDSRSIRHSRKLLSLFLAQTQGKILALYPLLFIEGRTRPCGSTRFCHRPLLSPTYMPTPCCPSLSSSCLVDHIFSLTVYS